MYEKAGRYQEAIDICKLAMNYGLTDTTGGALKSSRFLPKTTLYAGGVPKLCLSYAIWLGELQVSDNLLQGEGWSYDPESNTLTLNSPVITGLCTEEYYDS